MSSWGMPARNVMARGRRIGNPGVPTISLYAGAGQSAAAGAAVATPPVVQLRQANGAAAVGIAVTFAIGSGGGSLTGANATTDANGRATVGSWTLGSTAGSNTLTVTAAGYSGSPLIVTATGTGAGGGVADIPLTVYRIAAGSGTTNVSYGVLLPDGWLTAAQVGTLVLLDPSGTERACYVEGLGRPRDTGSTYRSVLVQFAAGSLANLVASTGWILRRGGTPALARLTKASTAIELADGICPPSDAWMVATGVCGPLLRMADIATRAPNATLRQLATHFVNYTESLRTAYGNTWNRNGVNAVYEIAMQWFQYHAATGDPSKFVYGCQVARDYIVNACSAVVTPLFPTTQADNAWYNTTESLFLHYLLTGDTRSSLQCAIQFDRQKVQLAGAMPGGGFTANDYRLDWRNIGRSDAADDRVRGRTFFNVLHAWYAAVPYFANNNTNGYGYQYWTAAGQDAHVNTYTQLMAAYNQLLADGTFTGIDDIDYYSTGVTAAQRGYKLFMAALLISAMVRYYQLSKNTAILPALRILLQNHVDRARALFSATGDPSGGPALPYVSLAGTPSGNAVFDPYTANLSQMSGQCAAWLYGLNRDQGVGTTTEQNNLLAFFTSCVDATNRTTSGWQGFPKSFDEAVYFYLNALAVVSGEPLAA